MGRADAVMTFEEALEVVEKGGKVARESGWVMCSAGFAWGIWWDLQRRWTDADIKRLEDRDWRTDPHVTPSGSYALAYHTLCEEVLLSGVDDVSAESREATDWIDVTDRFEFGMPIGWLEHAYGREEAKAKRADWNSGGADANQG